jgi:2-amino-4-hydroxy-6-hydroxymethyldihydropteridine diphosphokinase
MSPDTARAPVLAVVSIGANLGDAHATVQRAFDDLRTVAASDFRASNLWRTAPVEAHGPDFFNAICAFFTPLSAYSLLSLLQNMEQLAGRERPYVNAPRTLDLDLIFYGSAQIQSPTLTVPHPRWQQRAFVMYPLAELMPERVTPELRAAVSQQAIARLD